MNITITGMGIISSLGKNLEENRNNLFSGSTFISKPEYLQTNNNHFSIGEVKYSDKSLQEMSGEDHKGLSRSSYLSIVAAKEAIKNAGFDIDSYTGKIALISGSTVGGMRETEMLYKTYFQNDTEENYLENHEGASITEDLADILKINLNISVNTACSSSLNTIMCGARMIRNGLCDIAIVGGSDALSKFTLNGFNSLLLLDKEICKPFDRDRKGINLGEAAGYLILESESSAKNRNKTPIAKIAGYGNANDAHHPSASSEEVNGLQLSMKKALKEAGLDPSEIDFINAHGTGTRNNDSTEIASMKKVFGDIPQFSSTKSLTGHCLAAAGVVESIFSIISLQENRPVFNYNFKNPIEDTLPYMGEIFNKEIRHIMNNSIAMGGFCSTLIFSKVS
ncbi:beta-ketoacyl-[acyl-carrier-protein] synthase family protein [Flavobacterium chilense]|uniref:3-oxoacyl-(Acyl-carrier-protein) synthase n=1 Tax=Flavobacterium chilense TaxID=946677 RepID=A0A1M7MY16_9FLAO|nr:beta-ketoacyl-[acyl-carrier-protein] synthase family protein [Flavobacterium chilense]SHM95542.1 3-oxoacyl-(acyl-carrier-protein) synthase [Flavobacterium chilense]